MSTGRARLVVLASGGGTNLQAILTACQRGDIHADVVAVFSDRAKAGALERARAAGVAAEHADPHLKLTRRAYDTDLAAKVAGYEPTFVVLAGWMRLLSGNFLDRFPDQVVNLHPALPGELPGLHAIERAYAEWIDGLRTRSGVMVHLVPDELVDSGPVLGTIEVEIRPHDSPDMFERRMHEAEHELLVGVLASLCSPSLSSNTDTATARATTARTTTARATMAGTTRHPLTDPPKTPEATR
jgi:phosphoribosylglycinamide formyltransferase 1